ncbi:hypothetical protein LOTGIDRAFT_112482, partial [Lottia gigantea]
IVDIQYIPDLQALCIAVSDGTLIQWTVFNNELEEVGCVPSGIKTMCWSPDLELLILATGEEKFILMTREYDPIIESPLQDEQFGEAEFVTVGWGKKETQFHGSAGKQAAQQKQKEITVAVEGDDCKTRISWRGDDGLYFVTSFINKNTGARQLKVWTREGTLHSTSEPVDGLQQPLSWKPSGSLIASAKKSDNKQEIIFFEKNGLRHGEFILPFQNGQIKVKELIWNIDSSILCVWCEDIEHNSYVQLWTVNNYHWYLKQSLMFGDKEQVSAVHWDPEHTYRLHVTTRGGNYHQYTWTWVTNSSSGTSDKDQALVGVIDGKNVLMTPFRKMVVPPPMSAYNLTLPQFVQQVMFCLEDQYSNNIAVLLQDNTVAFYSYHISQGKECTGVNVTAAGGTGFSIKCQLPVFTGIYHIEGLESSQHPLSLYHTIWVKSDILVLITISEDGSCSTLYKTHVNSTNNKLDVKCKTDIENHVYNISKCQASDNLVLQLIDGTLLQYDLESDSILPWVDSNGDEVKFPSPCSTLSVCKLGGQVVVLGLTDRYRFYVNNIEVASNCSSFIVHSEFLLLTTLSHTLRCINLHTQLKDLPSLSDGKEHPFDESIRRVERGSRIVLVVPDDIKLILQMPRGNLEGIYPRALVLSAVRHHLDRFEYKKAYTIMKKHRINMNLLYDHNPTLFLNHITDFIQQIDHVTDLNIIVTGLQEEDVTVTMYTAAYQQTNQKQDKKESESKVDVICDSIRSALNKLDADRFLLSILTTYVRKRKPELEAALELIQQLRENPVKNKTVSAEEALKYLLFLVDVNELYNVALGTYDFDLVLMVAEKSQKDPKEYIPFLNELRRLEDNYRKYSIDKHLRRFNKALQHISHCGPNHFNECLKLIEDQKLYVEGLKCYPISSSEYKNIATNNGNYLLEKNRQDEAGVMFIKAEEWELALEAFITCKNWCQVFCMTALLGYTADREAEIGRKLAVQLKESRQHREAAVIFEQYVKDIEEAIVTLIEGEQWDEALRLMYRYKRQDFVETNLKPALEEKIANELESLENLKSDYIKYKTRLGVVRNTKENERLAVLEGGVGNMGDSDLFSDTSSAAGESVHSKYTYDSSRSTVFSKMTGKSRKRGSVRKWNLKEGSQFEDCALIEALAKIITTVTGFKEDINSLLKILVQYNYDDKASDIQGEYDELLTIIDTSIDEIWSNTGQTTDTVLGPNTTANSIAQAVQSGRQTTGSTDKLVLAVPPQYKKDVRWKLHMVQSSDS